MRQAHNPDEGRLTKLSRQNSEFQKKHEEMKLQRIMQAEMRAQAQAKRKNFSLPKVISEESLYAEVLNAYLARSLDRLEYYNEEFLKRYPNSVFADNALYLEGQLSMALGLSNEALRDFERLIKSYPRSNKRSAALLGKAVAYRKLHLFKYAERALNEVKKNYPGSAEYYKVELEQKLIQLEKKS